MLQQETRPTAFQRKITQRWVDLLFVNVCQDETLSVLFLHTCYLLAAQRFPRHPFARDDNRRVAFEAYLQRQSATWEDLVTWKVEPHLWETALLRILCEETRTRLPSLYAIFEKDDQLPNAMRHTACGILEAESHSEHDRDRIRQFINTIPFAFERLPDNPIRFTYNAETGQLDGTDLHLASTKQLLEIKSLRRIFGPKGVPGRPSGRTKPIGSGRKAVDPQLYKEAWEAKQTGGKYRSPSWWLVFARKSKLPIPEDSKGMTALRKKLEEWAIKGRTIAKKVGS